MVVNRDLNCVCASLGIIIVMIAVRFLLNGHIRQCLAGCNKD